MDILNEGVPAPKPLTLQEMLQRDVSATPAGQYAVVCIPMLDHGANGMPSAQYIANREQALALAKSSAEHNAQLTPDGREYLHPELFNYRRFAVYDSSQQQVGLYIGTPSRT